MIESSEAYLDAIVADARRMYIKAVVDIEDPDMTQGDVTGSEQEPGISRPMQLWDKEFTLNANYASMEPNRWILDGSYILKPDDAAARDWEAGYVGALLSGDGGVFAVPQIVQMDFANVGTLQACSVAFSDRPEDGVAADFTVEVISEGAAYYTKTVEGNTEALVPVTGFRVNHPDTIRVTVTRWSLPGRRMRVVEIVPGVYEVWTGDEMCEFSVKHQGDPSCLTLPYGTARIKMDNLNRRFDPRTKDGIFLMIEDRQGIDLYMGPLLPDGTIEYKHLGMFYQANGGWKNGDNGITMQWDLVDIVGLIAQRTYLQKGSAPTTLKGWLEALAGQLGENFAHRVRVDPEYAALPVSGSPAGLTCGDILRCVCMATGTWPRADASTGYLTAEPMWNDGNKITLDNLNKYPTMMANEDVAYITINGYTAAGNAPSCGNTVEITNPYVRDKVAAARSMLSFYGGNKIETLGRGDPASEIGDVDVIWLAEGNAASARRVKQKLTISGGVLKNCASTFVRGDGLFLFTNREQFLESGTWTVPDGVWQIRVVLVGRGSDGGDGFDGGWTNYRNQWMGQLTYPSSPGGGDGGGGAGGKIWEGVLDVNPGQVIEIKTGHGAGNTTLWHESSANGKTYPGGFTDVATGDVYGRSGCGGKPGSGNGGVGGRGGTPGEWYTRGHWYYDDGYVPPGGSFGEGGYGVDVNHRGPGHWEHEVVIVSEPTSGTPGGQGATGSAIIYWETPEVIDEDDDT